MFVSIRCPVILGLVFFFSRVTFGWNKFGHEAIAMTAMSALKGPTLAQLTRLLNGRDAVDVSAWAHKVNEKYPATIPMHFLLQTDTQGQTLSLSSCLTDKELVRLPKPISAIPISYKVINGRAQPENDSTFKESFEKPKGTAPCLIYALENFYKRLLNPSKTNDNWKLPNGLKLTDADSVKYLITLIGDLHQPLHLGQKIDEGGKTRMVRMQNDSNQPELVSLYDIWDTLLIDRMVKQDSAQWYGGWTHYNHARDVYETEKKRFAERESNSFLDWAKESAALAAKFVYEHPHSHKRIHEGDLIEPIEQLEWSKAIKNQIRMAGIRTAIVLNSLLNSREAARLRVGTGVRDIVDEDEIGKKKGPPVWLKNMLTNLTIMVAFVCLFAYLTRFYSTPRPHAPQVSGLPGKPLSSTIVKTS